MVIRFRAYMECREEAAPVYPVKPSKSSQTDRNLRVQGKRGAVIGGLGQATCCRESRISTTFRNRSLWGLEISSVPRRICQTSMKT